VQKELEKEKDTADLMCKRKSRERKREQMSCVKEITEKERKRDQKPKLPGELIQHRACFFGGFLKKTNQKNPWRLEAQEYE
jgi:hypothetical protein